jgi:hypothetical protein
MILADSRGTVWGAAASGVVVAFTAWFRLVLSRFGLVDLAVYALRSVDVQAYLGCIRPKPWELLADKVLGNKPAKLL